MAQQGVDVEPQASHQKNEDCHRQEVASPLDSGLRRKFLSYCEENPGADECRIYEV